MSRSTSSVQLVRRGFTMPELLLVIGIIGLLAAVSVSLLNISRAKSRDSKRVSDVQVVRAALEQHWLRNASYPAAAAPVSIGTGNYTVLSANGFEEAPTGDLFLKIPVGPKENEYYVYQSTVNTGFALGFTTEQTTSFGERGTYYAHGDGSIDTDPSSK